MTPEQRAELVLDDVDTVARNYDSYEYGLPMHCDGITHQMVKVVADAIRKAELAAARDMRERARDEAANHSCCVGDSYHGVPCQYIIAGRIAALPLTIPSPPNSKDENDR